MARHPSRSLLGARMLPRTQNNSSAFSKSSRRQECVQPSSHEHARAYMYTQKKVGVVAKDVPSGPLVTEWKAAYSEIQKDIEEVDITPAVSAALIVKDEKELVRCRGAIRPLPTTDCLTASNPRRLASLQRHHGKLLCRPDVWHS